MLGFEKKEKEKKKAAYPPNHECKKKKKKDGHIPFLSCPVTHPKQKVAVIRFDTRHQIH